MWPQRKAPSLPTMPDRYLVQGIRIDGDNNVEELNDLRICQYDEHNNILHKLHIHLRHTADARGRKAYRIEYSDDAVFASLIALKEIDGPSTIFLVGQNDPRAVKAVMEEEDRVAAVALHGILHASTGIPPVQRFTVRVEPGEEPGEERVRQYYRSQLDEILTFFPGHLVHLHVQWAHALCRPTVPRNALPDRGDP